MLKQDFIITNNPEDIEWNLIEILFCDWNETLDQESFTIIDSDLLEIYVLAGCFASKTLARKNGIDSKIPNGWTECGTKKKPIFIWNQNFPVV